MVTKEKNKVACTFCKYELSKSEAFLVGDEPYCNKDCAILELEEIRRANRKFDMRGLNEWHEKFYDLFLEGIDKYPPEYIFGMMDMMKHAYFWRAVEVHKKFEKGPSLGDMDIEFIGGSGKAKDMKKKNGR